MSQDARQRWQQRFDAALAAGKVRDADFTTLSGVEVDPVYGPADESAVPGFERIGYPGEFPFTRGLHATGYRGRAWTIRQFAGFGNAQQTNERYKMILAEGGGGLSVAFDMPTLMGRDSDDPRSLGEVGHCGVAIDTAADMDVLFADIPLDETTTSMTISGPADEAGVPGFERIGYPGEFPFTRGLHATGYRGRAWTIRQFAGFGNAQQTNERYKMILARGGGGLSVAFDMPTLMGRDSDEAESLGEVGH